MNLTSIAGFRLACVFAVCAAASAQSAPGARVVLVVDRSGAPVNTAWRSVHKPPASSPRAREIDRNESAVIDICLSYVDAQLTYFRSVPRADGHPAYADKIRSAAGMRDGLYWPLEDGDGESPMGPKFAAAAVTELEPGEAIPRFGYYFKILVSQGSEAVGGVQDYRVSGRMVAGFALIAWPAEYGVTGVRAFQVNHRGDVYAKDLGPDVGRAAAGMSAFAPDRTWTKVASAID